MNANKLVGLLYPQIEVVVDIPWHFSLAESLYLICFHWLYYFLFGVLLLRLTDAVKKDSKKAKMKKYGLLFLFFISCLFFGIYSQKHLFDNLMNSQVFKNTFIARFIFSSGLVYFLVRVLRLSKSYKAKELENEMLKSAYYSAQLKNLRAQVNPHFLFNSFSSLSSLIAEDTVIAQKYVGNLAKIFRYSLTENESPLVPLSKELDSLEANIELVKVRFEDSLKITISINEMEKYMIPFMSLQPLLENAIKHNVISKSIPGYINLFIEDNKLYFINGLMVQKVDTPSNGIGLFNLNERYKLLLNKEIEIKKTEDEFMVILPLAKNEKEWH